MMSASSNSQQTELWPQPHMQALGAACLQRRQAVVVSNSLVGELQAGCEASRSWEVAIMSWEGQPWRTAGWKSMPPRRPHC